MRIWFNRAFSSVFDALALIRRDDVGGRFYLIHTSSMRLTGASCAAHTTALEPRDLDGGAYVDWCLDFCRRERVDVFVPGRDATAIAAAQNRFAEVGTRVFTCAPAPPLQLLHDKAAFYAETQATSAPAPAYATFHDLAEFDDAYKALRARFDRLCIKPSSSVYGLGFAVIDEARSTAQLLFEGTGYAIGLQDLRNGLARMGRAKTMLLMEHLNGAEYSVDCVGDRGRVVCAVPRKKFLRARMGQEIVLRDDILGATAELASRYALDGLFNVQFKESEGKLRLLEINPRMSGGIDLACAAGPNLPLIALRGFVDGYDNVEVPPPANGLRIAHIQVATVLQ